MTRSDIEDLTIVKLEEYTPFGPSNDEAGPLLGGGDILKEVKPIYEYVSKSLPEAGNEILRVAPLNKLYPEEDYINVIVDRYRPLTGMFGVSDDFLRLHSLKMRGWRKTVHEVIMPEDPNFTDQDYDDSCGNYWKPVVTLENGFLHYYSVQNPCHHHVEEYKYIPDFMHCNKYTDAVAELIALNCAMKIYTIFGNVEQMNLKAAEIKSKLENLKR